MPKIRNISRFTAMIGWPGGVGVALSGAAIVMSVALSLPVRNENAVLKDKIAQMEASLQQPKTHSISDVRQQLDAFIVTLPPHDEINNSLNLLHELASRYGLSFRNSEYRPTQNRAEVIQQLRITVKTEGEYSNLRSFMQEVGQALPALAIGQLTLSRQKISDTRLETTVEFALFYSQRNELTP